MKKIVLIAFVLFLGLGVSAQTVGLRFGYNMSGLRIDDNFADYLDMMDINGKLTNGVNIGLVLERPINPKVDMHIELNFAQKGSAYDMYANTANSGTLGHGQTNLNYFELPIMAKIKFGPAYVAIGPHIGYLLGAQEINYKDNPTAVAGLMSAYDMTQEAAEAAVLASMQAAGQNITSLRDDEFYDMEMDNFNRFDFGGQFTVGAQVPVGPVKVFAEARATVALTNWEATPSFEAAGFDYKKNMAFTFAVGVLLNKHSK
ncbi:MAG: PorT family protein [Bacteroidales bacterium]|nr:PorT family protein [Bacteroidales bacterium]